MKSIKSLLFLISLTAVFLGCKENNGEPFVEQEQLVPENPATFKEVSTITLGTTGAAEISTYDPSTKKLFVVNNAVGSKVDVIDMSNFPTINKSQTLDFSTTSGVANSVSVSNGLLAVALEASVKTDTSVIGFHGRFECHC